MLLGRQGASKAITVSYVEEHLLISEHFDNDRNFGFASVFLVDEHVENRRHSVYPG